jgi:hypothetical protein
MAVALQLVARLGFIAKFLLSLIRLENGWVSVYSIGNALGFVSERFSFRIFDGASAVLQSFCDFPESIQGNGGLESGLFYLSITSQSFAIRCSP